MKYGGVVQNSTGYTAQPRNSSRVFGSPVLPSDPPGDIGQYFGGGQLTQNPLRYILSCYDALILYFLFFKSYEPLHRANLGDSTEIERWTRVADASDLAKVIPH